MNINIVEIGIMTLKDGSSYSFIKGLAHVQKFGKLSLELIVIKVPDNSKYKIGEADVDIVLPFSEYAYLLA